MLLNLKLLAVQGFLNLNKPFGWTSHDCVARVRKLLRLKRVGHGGTLDPAATGVLPIALGKATRLLPYLPGEKVYQATIRFGVRTTTDDLEGEIINSQPAFGLDLPEVKAALCQFLGKIEQIPPSYSAIQVGGKRLYDLARQGEVVTAPARTVEILQTEVLDWRPGIFPNWMWRSPVVREHIFGRSLVIWAQRYRWVALWLLLHVQKVPVSP